MKNFGWVLCYLLPFFLPAQNDFEFLEHQLDSLYRQSDLPGFAVSIVDNNGVLFQQAFGFADLADKRRYTIHTIQNIGSVSKTIVGVAFVKAVKQGLLQTEQPINTYLPFEVKNPHFKSNPILMTHLLNHTSGILDGKFYGHSYIKGDNGRPRNREHTHLGYENFLGKHQALSFDGFLAKTLSPSGKWYRKKHFLKEKPGSTYTYSNINASIAAYAIERQAGQSFADFTQKHIFQPLKMASTSWHFTTDNTDKFATLYFPSGYIVPGYQLVTYPDGGLRTNVQDLANYLVEVIRAFGGKSGLLSPAEAKMLLPGDGDDQRAFWGMNTKTGWIGHEGSDPGVQCTIQFHHLTKRGYALICNVNAEDQEELWRQYQAIQETIERCIHSQKNSQVNRGD